MYLVVFLVFFDELLEVGPRVADLLLTHVENYLTHPDRTTFCTLIRLFKFMFKSNKSWISHSLPSPSRRIIYLKRGSAIVFVLKFKKQEVDKVDSFFSKLLCNNIAKYEADRGFVAADSIRPHP